MPSLTRCQLLLLLPCRITMSRFGPIPACALPPMRRGRASASPWHMTACCPRQRSAEGSGWSCRVPAYHSSDPCPASPAPQIGLPLLAGIQPAYASPYGIAVQRGDLELNDRLTVALVRVMSSGDASDILRYERQYLVANGVGPSQSLDALVTSISEFDAPTTGPRESAPRAGNNNFIGGQLAG